MFSQSICAICLSSLFVTSQAAWGATLDDALFEGDDQGQIVFVSPSGELDSDPGLTFDQEEQALKVDRFIADEFYGDSINFRGREIRNAHLIESSIEGLKHLTVESLALVSRDSTDKHGHGLAVIDGDGLVSSTRQMRWDETARELKVPNLSSFSKSGLEIRSDVDLTDHQLKNAKFEANTLLSQLIFKDGYIENSVLHNVTATDLNLGDVTLDSLSISQFHSVPDVGSLVVVGEGGKIETSSMLKQEKEGHLLIDSSVVLTKSMNVNGQDILNANLRSGTIEGKIDVSVNHVKAKGLTLTEIREDKTVHSDFLAVLDSGGKLTLGPISVDKSGNLGDFAVHGTVDFGRDRDSGVSESDARGKIKSANISGGTINGIERLSVVGETELGSGLQVSGETYLDGSLTVSGSVLGSGPYVDVSDKRFKKNVEKMNSSDVLGRILLLEGVSYELDISKLREHGRLGERNMDDAAAQTRQFGFIAQDVERLFPEIVSGDEDNDFRGLQYSRFAPILAEGLKQLADEVRVIREEKNDMKRMINLLEERLKALEDV